MPISRQFDRTLQRAMAAAAKAKDVAKLPAPVRHIALVHAAQGVIDNGGLQYFFEADFPNKPDYALFIEAYRAIGATEAAQALEEAVALFPFDSPHKFVKERNAFLDRFRNDDDQARESPFEPLTDRLCGNKTVWQKLEAYAALHAAVVAGCK
jgi:hypothetical protein